MPFVFRLERVLAVRRIEEEQAQQRHAAAREHLRIACVVRDEARARLRQSLQRLDELKRRDELTEEALYLHSLHVAGVRRKIEVALAEVAAAEQEGERTAAELLAAHQAREALERLREREEISWRKAQSAREAKEIDEMAVLRSRAREEENHGP